MAAYVQFTFKMKDGTHLVGFYYLTVKGMVIQAGKLLN